MSAWNTERVNRLKTLWASGRSAAWIANELGGDLTRNAVLAKVWRLGLSGAPRVTRPVRRSHPSPGTAVAPMSPPQPPSAQGVASILSVQRLDCRWPCGDPRADDFSLCGARVRRGVYCEAHAAIAYRNTRQSMEALLRWAGLA